MVSDAKSFKDNTGLNGHLFNEFDLHLRVDDKLPQDLQASYVDQCTSPAPLTGPRSLAGAGASRSSSSSVASARSQSDRSLRMRLQLPADVEAIPPSVLALYIRACEQLPEPNPLDAREVSVLHEQYLTLVRQGAKVGPFSWCSLLRTVRAIARLHMAAKVTTRHMEVSDANDRWRARNTEGLLCARLTGPSRLLCARACRMPSSC